MAIGIWEFWLANSSDMSRIMPLAKATDKQLSIQLNRPGSFQFNFPIDDRDVDYILPVETCVIAYRNGVAKWSGPVWTTQESYPEDKMQVSCVGWWEIINHRLLTLPTYDISNCAILNPSFTTDASNWSIGPSGTVGRSTAAPDTAPGYLVYSTAPVSGSGPRALIGLCSGTVSPQYNYEVTASFKLAGGLFGAIQSIFIGTVSDNGQFAINDDPASVAYFVHKASWTPKIAYPPAVSFADWAADGKWAVGSLCIPNATGQIDTVTLKQSAIYRTQVSFAGVDAGLIAHTLIADINADSPSPISVGSRVASQPRTRTYKKYDNTGRAIQELIDIESGFDFQIDPLTRAMNIFATLGSNKTEAVFGYNSGPNNIISLTRNLDGSVLANRVFAFGKSTFGTGVSVDYDSISRYRVLDDLLSLSTVVDIGILIAAANIETALRAFPRQTFEIVPEPNTFPFPFDDYDIGDIVFLSMNRSTKAQNPLLIGSSSLDRTSQIERPPLLNKQGVRVFGFGLSIGEDGVEKLAALQVAP